MYMDDILMSNETLRKIKIIVNAHLMFFVLFFLCATKIDLGKVDSYTWFLI